MTEKLKIVFKVQTWDYRKNQNKIVIHFEFQYSKPEKIEIAKNSKPKTRKI